MFDLWLITLIANLWERVLMNLTGFRWYLAIQTVILEIVWLIMLWWGIHTGDGGIWFAWSILTILATFSSVWFAASILGSFDSFKQESPKRATNGDYLP